jgi:phospholipid/cholesterol/gamma-HCH transport system substrate-binding protein
MARRLSWSDVRGGLIACIVIGVAAFAILKFMRVGALHGDTFPLYALVGEARGVTNGSEVWLSGQKIGKITDIQFRSPAIADTTNRILITMVVLEEHRRALRRDAIAQIRAGGSIVGPPVVYLSPGTPRAAPLQPGDTVRTLMQSDVEGATAQFGAATQEFPVIMANVKVLRSQLQGAQGTMGALMNGPGMGELQKARIQTGQLMARVSGNGGGTGGSIGPIMNGGLTGRAGRVMARVDSVRALLASRRTSLGRLRRDSTLMGEVSDIRNELTLVQATLDDSRGTIGRARTDSALTTALGEAQREMTLLVADIKKHPRRYLSVSF